MGRLGLMETVVPTILCSALLKKTRLLPGRYCLKSPMSRDANETLLSQRDDSPTTTFSTWLFFLHTKLPQVWYFQPECLVAIHHNEKMTHDQRYETLVILNCGGEPLPEAAGGVLEDGGPLGVAGLRVLVGLVLPPRVGDDDLVGHRLQAVVDDHHLQGLVGRQVPQGSCRARPRAGGGGELKKKKGRKKKIERRIKSGQ